MDDDEGSRSFEYNSLGQLTSETRTIGGESYTTSYSYSSTTGELESMTYPSGRVLAYTRDSIGRISTVNLDGAPLFSNGSYLPLGPLKSVTLGNQISLSRDYDLRYQINRIQGAGLDYGYTRDAGGHVTGISNIQLPETNSEITDYTYPTDSNRLSSSTGDTPRTYTYDAVGNMTSDGVFTFTYDGLNRIVQVEKDSAIIATYGYDSQHRRIRKTVGSVTTRYHYDSSNLLIGETLADGTPVRDYFYVNGEPIGVQEYQSNPGVYYIINDHLGTPQQLVDDAGTVFWLAGYLPFGKAQVQVETVVNNLRFPGQYFDAETGLHYNWNRFYDPSTGRYISADPIGLRGGLNLYAYTKGNPVNAVDPMGLAPWDRGSWINPKCHPFTKSPCRDGKTHAWGEKYKACSHPRCIPGYDSWYQNGNCNPEDPNESASYATCRCVAKCWLDVAIGEAETTVGFGTIKYVAELYQKAKIAALAGTAGTFSTVLSAGQAAYCVVTCTD